MFVQPANYILLAGLASVTCLENDPKVPGAVAVEFVKQPESWCGRQFDTVQLRRDEYHLSDRLVTVRSVPDYECVTWIEICPGKMWFLVIQCLSTVDTDCTAHNKVQAVRVAGFR